MLEETSAEVIQRRKISSMDFSPLHPSLDSKIEALNSRTFPIKIPTYPLAKAHKGSALGRLASRMQYFFAILKQRASGREYPLIAVLVVNNHCNWNCTYCFGDYPNRKEIDYTTDEVKFLIDELYSLGVRYINMHGGETFLRKDLGELCRYIKQKKMYLGVITNGSLLPGRVEEIRPVDSLTISLDGREENNDKVRGKGTYAKSLQAIELALAEDIPLRVSATLTKHTMGDIGYLAELAKEKKFALYFSILFKPLKKARDSQMSNDEIRKALLEIQEYKTKRYPIFTSETALKSAYEWPFDYNETHHASKEQLPESYKSHQIECFYGRTKFTIEADGFIYPCFLTTDGSFKPLNWKDVGLAQAISHVQKTNRCVACPALSHSDHSLVLGLNFKQIFHVIRDQFKEAF